MKAVSVDLSEPAPMTRSRWRAYAFRMLGLAALGLALAGIVLPGLPTTPFLLVSVWAFGHGAPEWAARVERHPRLGPLLRNWRERRIVPVHAKVFALVSMAGSYALLWWIGAGQWLLVGVGVTLLVVASYLLSKPSR